MKPAYPEKNSCTGKMKHKMRYRMSAASLRFAAAVLMITVFLTDPTSAVVVSGNTHLGVEVSEITPNPARPGEDLLIKISIQNAGDEPQKT